MLLRTERRKHCFLGGFFAWITFFVKMLKVLSDFYAFIAVSKNNLEFSYRYARFYYFGSEVYINLQHILLVIFGHKFTATAIGKNTTFF